MSPICHRYEGNGNIWRRRESIATPVTRANLTLNAVRAGQNYLNRIGIISNPQPLRQHTHEVDFRSHRTAKYSWGGLASHFRSAPCIVFESVFLRYTPFFRSVHWRYIATKECKNRPDWKPGARGAYPYPHDWHKRGGTPEKATIHPRAFTGWIKELGERIHTHMIATIAEVRPKNPQSPRLYGLKKGAFGLNRTMTSSLIITSSVRPLYTIMQ